MGSRGIICERVKEVYNINNLEGAAATNVGRGENLGEVRTISKKEKRVREVRRKWGERKQQKLLGGEGTNVGPPDMKINTSNTYSCPVLPLHWD